MRHPKDGTQSYQCRNTTYLRTPLSSIRWQLWSAWHSPLIFYLTCSLCINMEEPELEPEPQKLGYFSRLASQPASHPVNQPAIASFVSPPLPLQLLHFINYASCSRARRLTSSGWGAEWMGTARQCSSHRHRQRHRHRLRHDKVVICWQLKVLLIVQLIDVIN